MTAGKFSGEEGAWTGWGRSGSSTRQGSVSTAAEGTAETAWEGPMKGKFVISKKKLRGEMAGAGLHGSTAVSGVSPGMGEGVNVAHAVMRAGSDHYDERAAAQVAKMGDEQVGSWDRAQLADFIAVGWRNHAALSGKMCGDYLAYKMYRAKGYSPEEADRLAGQMIPEHGGRDEVSPTPLEPGGHVSATRPAGSSAKMSAFQEGMAFERAHGQSQDNDAARERRVREHLAERPTYYVELARYLNPDIGGMAGKMKEERDMDSMVDMLEDEGDSRYNDHPAAYARVDDLWREDPKRYNGKLFIVPANLLSPREAGYQADLDPGRVLHCGNCGAYRGGDALTGQCGRLQAMSEKPGAHLKVHYFNTCVAHRPKDAGTPVEGAPKGNLDSSRPRALMRKGVGALPTVASIAGSSPRERTPSLPDYQDIYYQPKDDEHARREREQGETRRLAERERSRATYGFHGSPGSNLSSEPVLRYESDLAHDDSKRAVHGAEALIGQREPIVEAPEVMDRHNAGSPYAEDGAPPGATDYGRVPRSPDERDDETVPDINGRPIPLDPEDVEGDDASADEAAEADELEEAAGAPFDEDVEEDEDDDEDDSLLEDQQGRVE